MENKLLDNIAMKGIIVGSAWTDDGGAYQFLLVAAGEQEYIAIPDAPEIDLVDYLRASVFVRGKIVKEGPVQRSFYIKQIKRIERI